jgi:hypothetical protein
MNLRALILPLASLAVFAAASAACSSSSSTGGGTTLDGGSTPSDGSTGQPCIGVDGGPCTIAGDDSDGSVADSGSVGAACTLDTDCTGDTRCAFLESDGCAAKGSCISVDKSGGNCNAIVLVCACDGTEANGACTGLPAGYVSKPVVYPTQSGCASVDAGLSDDGSADQ